MGSMELYMYIVHVQITERKFYLQFIIGRIRANLDLCSIWAKLWVSLGFKFIKSHLRIAWKQNKLQNHNGKGGGGVNLII